MEEGETGEGTFEKFSVAGGKFCVGGEMTPANQQQKEEKPQ
jgi:hypothetical protein